MKKVAKTHLSLLKQVGKDIENVRGAILKSLATLLLSSGKHVLELGDVEDIADEHGIDTAEFYIDCDNVVEDRPTTCIIRSIIVGDDNSISLSVQDILDDDFSIETSERYSIAADTISVDDLYDLASAIGNYWDILLPKFV